MFRNSRPPLLSELTTECAQSDLEVTQKVYMFSATMNKYRRPQHIQQLYQLRDYDTDLYTDVEHRAISIKTGDAFAAGTPETP